MNNQNNSVNNDSGFKGVGDVYFYPEDSDKALFFGNTFVFEVSSSSESKKRKSRKKKNSGAVLDSVNVSKATEVKLSTDTFQPLTWAMALMGEASTVTTTAETITDEQAKAVLSGYHPLANQNIDPATVVVKKAGTTLESSAYDLNTDMGLLQITDETVANEGDDLTVDYRTITTTKDTIDSAKVSSFKGKLVLDGVNEVTKKRFVKTVKKANLAFNGKVDFLSDEYNSIEMSGTAEVGDDGEAPTDLDLYR